MVSTPAFKSTSESSNANASQIRSPVQAIRPNRVCMTAPRGLIGGPMRPAASTSAAISSSRKMCGVTRPGIGPKIDSSGTSVAGSNCCSQRVKGRSMRSARAHVALSPRPPLACRAHDAISSTVNGPRWRQALM
jgi:hypothetical protein